MSLPHLLLIEDDPDLLSILSAELQDAGYRVTTATSVMWGLIQARETAPDLVVTDLELPDGDGRDIVIRLRSNSQVPIMVMTARDDVAEKVALLKLGANDYLVKPFSPEKLLARIAVRLRNSVTDTLRLGELEMQPSKHLVTLNGQDLQLSGQELALVELFLQQPGRVYSRADLAHALWNDRLHDKSRAIDTHLCSIREKLRQLGGHVQIRNVHGIGYALRLKDAVRSS